MEYKQPEVPLSMLSEAEVDALYEKAEMDLLRDALKRTHKERFLMMTSLMKMNNTFRKAKITFTPYTLNK
ncbi:MAG: hypothetical protein MUE72_07420 [Chitinophagaceae bacterium]|nr:hypothetical protein [Chitinophagaceae bacterium]